jgi:hypothetical protein
MKGKQTLEEEKVQQMRSSSSSKVSDLSFSKSSSSVRNKSSSVRDKSSSVSEKNDTCSDQSKKIPKLNVFEFYENLKLESSEDYTTEELFKAKKEAIDCQDSYLMFENANLETVQLNKKCIDIAYKFLVDKGFG